MAGHTDKGRPRSPQRDIPENHGRAPRRVDHAGRCPARRASGMYGANARNEPGDGARQARGCADRDATSLGAGPAEVGSECEMVRSVRRNAGGGTAEMTDTGTHVVEVAGLTKRFGEGPTQV